MIHAFPKKHIVAAAFIGTLLIIVLALSPSSKVNATRIPIEIALPTIDTSQTTSPLMQQSQETSSEIPQSQNWDSFNIKSGDTLSDLFVKAGLNDKLMYEVIYSHPDNKQLTRIFPGEQIAFSSNEKDELEQIKLVRSPTESVLFTKGDNGKYSQSIVIRNPDVHISCRTKSRFV